MFRGDTFFYSTLPSFALASLEQKKGGWAIFIARSHQMAIIYDHLFSIVLIILRELPTKYE